VHASQHACSRSRHRFVSRRARSTLGVPLHGRKRACNVVNGTHRHNHPGLFYKILLRSARLSCTPSPARLPTPTPTAPCAPPSDDDADARALARPSSSSARPAVNSISGAKAMTSVSFFLWPVAGPVAAVATVMKAPGAGGLLISSAAFLASRKLHYALLRKHGVAAAVATCAPRAPGSSAVATCAACMWVSLRRRMTHLHCS
jgi:hypothetical protein